MNYYIFINSKNLKEEEIGQISKFTKNLKMKDFDEFGDNTLYITFKENKPFVYKVTHTDVKEELGNIETAENPFRLPITEKSKTYLDIPTYNITIIEEEIER